MVDDESEKSKDEHITLRVSSDLKQRLDEEATARGIARSRLITDLLKEGLQLNLKPDDTPEASSPGSLVGSKIGR